MRLFVALVPAGEALRELSVAVEELTATAAGDGLRWTAHEGRHITLAFLGEVAPERLPDLTERLARAARRHPPLTLRLDGGGRFGDHVLWAGVAGDTVALSHLAASVTAAARRARVPVEDRPFRPHITLARPRHPTSLRPLSTALTPFHGSPWQATHLHLIRSHPAPDHHYETLAKWDLGG